MGTGLDSKSCETYDFQLIDGSFICIQIIFATNIVLYHRSLLNNDPNGKVRWRWDAPDTTQVSRYCIVYLEMLTH